MCWTSMAHALTWSCHAEGQEGPLSKAELKQAFARGQVGLGTPFWAAGMAEPQPLAAIRELRWLVSHRLGTPSPPSCLQLLCVPCAYSQSSVHWHLLTVTICLMKASPG